MVSKGVSRPGTWIIECIQQTQMIMCYSKDKHLIVLVQIIVLGLNFIYNLNM